MEYTFENGLGASVIDDGYGGRNGLFEIALLKAGSIVHNEALGFQYGVKGWLTADEVSKVLTEISEFDVTNQEFSANPIWDN